MTIKRYDKDIKGEYGLISAVMNEQPDGDYVLYSDHIAAMEAVRVEGHASLSILEGFSESPITDEEHYLIGKASQALYHRCEQSRGKPNGKQVSAEHDAMMRLRRRHEEVEAALSALSATATEGE